MSSMVYFSTQFDDAQQLVAELIAPIETVPPNGLGILLCDSQVDIHTVLAQLGEVLNIPLVGGTTLAFPFGDTPSYDISATLLILDKPGMTFSVAVSAPLNQAGHATQIQDVYARAREQLGEEPRLIMPFFPLIPGLLMDPFITDLFRLAGDVPLFGGTTVGDLISTPAAVFAEGRVLSDRAVLVMLGGSVRPVFAAANSMTPMTDYAPTVSHADACTLRMVDDMTFCDYLRSVGIAPEDRVNGVDALMQYGPIPLEVLSPDKPDDGVSEIRCISYTDLCAGSAAISAMIPEGAKIRMGILARDNITNSVKDAMDELKTRMRAEEAKGHSFSALLCVSCVARYFVMVGGNNEEQAVLHKTLPPGVAAGGYYGFCEIGPTYAADGARHYNRSHSASIVLCAL